MTKSPYDMSFKTIQAVRSPLIFIFKQVQVKLTHIYVYRITIQTTIKIHTIVYSVLSFSWRVSRTIYRIEAITAYLTKYGI